MDQKAIDGEIIHKYEMRAAYSCRVRNQTKSAAPRHVSWGLCGDAWCLIDLRVAVCAYSAMNCLMCVHPILRVRNNMPFIVYYLVDKFCGGEVVALDTDKRPVRKRASSMLHVHSGLTVV
jgi:hypothetical protein